MQALRVPGLRSKLWRRAPRFAYGQATFANLSRYSHLNERTYRRQYQRSFNFMKFNQQLIRQAMRKAKLSQPPSGKRAQAL